MPQSDTNARHRALTDDEHIALSKAVLLVEENARGNAYKRPAMTTLIEEMAELTLALRGKHDDPVDVELVQIAGVAVNLLWQWNLGHEEHVNNIVTFTTEKP